MCTIIQSVIISSTIVERFKGLPNKGCLKPQQIFTVWKDVPLSLVLPSISNNCVTVYPFIIIIIFFFLRLSVNMIL
jgi:hypothetical protein